MEPEPILWGVGIALVLVLVIVVAAVRIVAEYERGVIFRLGRLQGAKGPGLFFIIPVVDRMVRVNLQTFTRDVPHQDIITRDNVTVRVSAVTYFNVLDPVKSVVSVQNYVVATSQVSQTTLRSVVGQVDLDDLLADRDRINARLQATIDDLTEPWGVKVTLVEIKDVELPEGMRRAMGRQAEAERDRRAKVIHALGEQEAAEGLGQAAHVLHEYPGALQLRVLSTMVEVAAERNSTLVFPVPMELLRLAETVTQAVSAGAAGSTEGERNGDEAAGEAGGDVEGAEAPGSA